MDPSGKRCADCSHFLYDGLYNGLLRACTAGGEVHELETMEMRQVERCGCNRFREKVPQPGVRKSTPEFLRKIIINLDNGAIHTGSNPTEGKASR